MKIWRPKLWAGWAGAVGFAALGLHFFPLFHVVPLQTARQQAADAAFNAEAFVESFWNEQLLQARAQAIEADQLVAALRENPAAASKLGRQLGMSRATSYFVSGTGRIVCVSPEAVSIALHGGSDDDAVVVIETGPVFGNAIRDGSGLLDVSAFPNSRDFNAISTAINRRVEDDVLPALRSKAAVGSTVRFLGCAEVDDPASGVSPLRVVPIRIEWP
jgi:predicted lipoprotein